MQSAGWQAITIGDLPELVIDTDIRNTMESYDFGIGIVLLLSFLLAGLSIIAGRMLRKSNTLSGPSLLILVGFTLLIGFTLLVALIAALVWAVPPRG